MYKDKDIFGNIIDPEVGYARGKILNSSFAEKLKYNHSLNKISQRIQTFGKEQIYLFTGNYRWNSLYEEDLGIYSEEWVGPSLFQPKLKELTLKHLGGKSFHEIAIFNRTSAGIICSILALIKPGQLLISFAPKNQPHPSIIRGAKLARAKYLGVETIEEFENKLNIFDKPSLCVITPVTSELLLMENKIFIKAIDLAKKKNFTVLVDDAYGARIRTIILDQIEALKLRADIVITNNDKAGLRGPRAGIMAGSAKIVTKVSARANECGMEARAPIALGVLRSLEKFQPNDLKEEVESGNELTRELVKIFGVNKVRKTILGPEISAEHLLEYIVESKKISYGHCSAVPAEASAAVAFVLLEKYGIILVNIGGMPGSRVSLRLKAQKETVNRFGGPKKVADAILDSILLVADYVRDEKKLRELIIGV